MQIINWFKWFKLNWPPLILLPCVIMVFWLLEDAMYTAAALDVVPLPSVRAYSLVLFIFVVTGLFFMGMEHAENLRKAKEKR